MESTIKILGGRGKLSNGLINIIKNKNEKIKKVSNGKTILVATYSPTSREDKKENLNHELSYYKKLVKSLGNNDHLIYISSQTVELTNKTYYSKAKIETEKLIIKNATNFTIIRPGMIFDNSKKQYLLDSMQRSTSSYFSFYQDIPKTTVCSIDDIFSLIEYLSMDLNNVSGKIINIGIKRFRFYQLQNLSKKKKFRMKLIPFKMIYLIGFFNARLKAYSKGNSNSNAPDFAWQSTIDKLFI